MQIREINVMKDILIIVNELPKLKTLNQFILVKEEDEITKVRNFKPVHPRQKRRWEVKNFKPVHPRQRRGRE